MKTTAKKAYNGHAQLKAGHAVYASRCCARLRCAPSCAATAVPANGKKQNKMAPASKTHFKNILLQKQNVEEDNSNRTNKSKEDTNSWACTYKGSEIQSNRSSK